MHETMKKNDTLEGAGKQNSGYAYYVLMVLTLVYVLNFIDRNILTILAEDIKADLGLTDADMGFLVGTAFTVFYTTFGIALGRLADMWNRKTLISIGLGAWSLMTALSGLAKSFAPLAVCRFGVAVGEASASPAAYSILYDYFSPKVRTTVLAIYGSGLSIGAGIGLFLGGSIIDGWAAAYPDASLAPFGLKGWQVAFMAVGLPGFLMAFWVYSLREPVRGMLEGVVVKASPRPFHETFMVLVSMLPVCNLPVLAKAGRSVLLANIVMALIVFVAGYVLVGLTAHYVQWITMGLGIYAVISWAQVLMSRDRVVFDQIFKCKALQFLSFGMGVNLFAATGIGIWAVPLLMRKYDIAAADIGLVLGLGSAIAGLLGVISGGLLADKLRAYTKRGKLYVLIASVIVSSCIFVVFLLSANIELAFACMIINAFVGSASFGPGLSTVNDLVIPRARATSTSFFNMITVIIGGALGPYTIGQVSDFLTAAGADGAQALQQSMLWSMISPVFGLALLVLAWKHVERDEATTMERARQSGELI